MRKLLLIFICLTLLLGNVFAASNEIGEMDVRIDVDSNGTCRVTVRAEVRFTDRPTTFEFPLGTDAGNITASGASYRSRTLDGVKCIIFENESGFLGNQTFQCTYTLPCTMWESGGQQHFKVNIPERGMAYPINRFSLTIAFPGDITAFPLWHSAYYGDVIDNYMSIQIKDNTVTAKSNIVFRDHETLSMSLAFEPDVFELKHLAEQTVTFDRAAFFMLYAVCILYWLFALLKTRVKVKNDILFHFESSAGEVPCQLYGSKADVGGLIAHWGRLGYILLHRTKRGVFRLEKQMPMGNERSTAERRLFHSIFHSTDFIEVPGHRFLSAVNTEGSILTAHWKRRMFEKKDGNPKLLNRLCLCVGLILSLMIFDTLLAATPGRWFWLVVLTLLSLPLHLILQQVIPRLYRPERWIYLILGVVSITVLYLLAVPAACGMYLFFHILLQLGAGYVTRFGGQRSLAGQEIVQELLHLRRFVFRSDSDSVAQCLRSDSQYFYRILPYAEIMGVGKRFLKHFGPATTEACPWLVDEKSDDPSAQAFYNVYTELVRQLRREESLSLLRTLKRDFYIPLPRIRPGGSSAGSRSTANRSAAASGHRRNHTYTNKARRPVTHPDKGDCTAVHAGRRPPYRTQHRANPHHTGRRS